jgi:hypothetical protein
MLSEMLDFGQITDSQRRKYIAALRKLCGNRGILPTSHFITDGLNKLGERPVGGGGFADVWEGSYRSQKGHYQSPEIVFINRCGKSEKGICYFTRF